jgi:hypothetical protein
VLGVLRLDWADVASIVGVAVTPVVGYVGDLSKEQLRPNPDEVSHCFTIPLKQVRKDVTVPHVHAVLRLWLLAMMLAEPMRYQMYGRATVSYQRVLS